MKTYTAATDKAKGLRDGTITMLVIPFKEQPPYCAGDVVGVKGTTIRLLITSVQAKQVQSLTPEQMLAAGLEAFGWDYAEGGASDDDGAMFAYWDFPIQGPPPAWASWASSCECIEDIWRSYWYFRHPDLPWSGNPWAWFYEVERQA